MRVAGVDNMQNDNQFLSRFYDYLVTDFDEESGVMWCYANPSPRPCFTSELLTDLVEFLDEVKNSIKNDLLFNKNPRVKFLVLGSYRPGVFSLGGDLSLFIDCIEYDKDPEVSLADAAKVLEVLFAAYRSAATGEVVRLPLPR